MQPLIPLARIPDDWIQWSSELTPAENRIVCALATVPSTVNTLAPRLGLTYASVRTHRERAYSKAHWYMNRANAASLALVLGMISPDDVLAAFHSGEWTR